MQSSVTMVWLGACALGASALVIHGASAQTVQVLPAGTAAWQTAYNGFTTQASFESVTLPVGLSVTLEGGAFASAQSYSSLPSLFDPGTVSSSGGFGGPYPNNRWDGTHMVTNFGYDAGQAPGQNWTNSWAPTTASLASKFTFNFADGVSAMGLGLSNFQSEITSHTLFINGVQQAQTIESIAGGNWVSGRLIRNGYLVVTAAPGSPIYSISIATVSALDGLNFDALGYDAVPAPGSASLLGLAAALSARRLRS